MSLTNPTDVVTEERLSEFYQAILPYLGGMPEAVVNKFSKSDLYSTTEKIVGCWTDGRPVYQKTISCGALPNNTTKNITIDVANVSQIVGLSGFVYNSSTKAVFDMNSLMSNTTLNNNFVIYASYNSSTSKYQISMSTKTDISAYSAYVTVRYTKTTDAANSFNFSTETDYSTTEKIVGTWINGKPLYQKVIPTILSSSISAATWTNITDANTMTNADVLVRVGVLKSTEHRTFICADFKVVNNRLQAYVPSGVNYFNPTEVIVQYTKTTD